MNTYFRFRGTAALIALAAAAFSQGAFSADPIAIAPAKMPRIGTVDERFQSFNVEMVEVTGGRFWAPYQAPAASQETAPAATSAVPGLDPAAFRNRPPIDLANPRLRKLAAAR